MEEKIIANLVIDKISLKENQGLTKRELIDLILPDIYKFASEQRNTGRRQILNHIQDEINGLKG